MSVDNWEEENAKMRRPWWTDEMMETSQDSSFVSQTMACFGFCGCGRPRDVVLQMLAYLESCADKHESGPFDAWYEGWKSRHPIADSPQGMWCAYIADKMKWTEHGSAVTAAWLDGNGYAWLEDARKWKNGEVG